MATTTQYMSVGKLRIAYDVHEPAPTATGASATTALTYICVPSLGDTRDECEYQPVNASWPRVYLSWCWIVL
jgi:hypothetical protein